MSWVILGLDCCLSSVPLMEGGCLTVPNKDTFESKIYLLEPRGLLSAVTGQRQKSCT